MRETAKQSFIEVNSVAVIGNYLPRKCGIATFTTDLVKSISSNIPYSRCEAIAINDKPGGYNYPHEVRFEINQDNLSDYHTAAEFLNINHFDIISLQHEFGIFGGASGDYILTLLEDLQKPVVTTLHTVLTHPSQKQKQIMERLTDLSDRLVVMSKNAIDILHVVYDIPKEKIIFIPHGIPDMPFVDPSYYKEQFDLLGQKVLLTFGLLSQDKGLEYVIKGLPKVIKQIPDIKYIILGATHPDILEAEGEKYRNRLHGLVEQLNLSDHVIFKNHFVSFEELCDYLAATDVYITPYNSEEQITSGTLAYAAGTGKAVISTPYWYAKEMLSGGRGRLVPFKDEHAMADAILELFQNDAERHQMRKRAYDYNRNATWKEVARQYMDVFHEIKSEQNKQPRPYETSSSGYKSINGAELQLPDIKIDHLLTLTDDTGLMQHASFTTANREHGYCTDDNARALIVAMRAQNVPHIKKADSVKLDELSNLYLGFLLHSYNNETARFRNFFTYARQWKNAVGSKDAHGRALWALGETVSSTKHNSDLTLASKLFMRALKTAESFDSPRAIAFTQIGIREYLKTFNRDSKVRRTYKLLAERLFEQFKQNASEDWPWPEDILTYSNGKLPHALILAGDYLEREDMRQMGLQALNWLLDIQTENGHLAPIGNQSWYKRNEKKSRFDQQPVEINALVEASIAAYKSSGNKNWIKRAKFCFSWFLGNNDLNLPLYDPRTGGCHDGLQPENVNKNEGGESTLAWLMSLIIMHQLSDSSTSLNGKGEVTINERDLDMATKNNGYNKYMIKKIVHG